MITDVYVGPKKNKEECIKYVKKKRDNNKKIQVKFAGGGGIFGAINGARVQETESTPEVISNINYYVESQFKKGKERLGSYKRLGGICAGLSAIMSGISMVAPTAFEAIASTVQTQANLEDAASAVVVVGAVSAIATGITAFDNIRKVLKIQKISYRDENKAILDSVKIHTEATETLSERKKQHIKECDDMGADPFGIIWSSYYTLRDLKKIVERLKQTVILKAVSKEPQDYPVDRGTIEAELYSKQPVETETQQPAYTGFTPEQNALIAEEIAKNVQKAFFPQTNAQSLYGESQGNQDAPQYTKK